MAVLSFDSVLVVDTVTVDLVVMRLAGYIFRRDVNGPLELAVVTFHLRAYWSCSCCAVREKVEGLEAP
jgi:hypothetical protein